MLKKTPTLQGLMLFLAIWMMTSLALCASGILKTSASAALPTQTIKQDKHAEEVRIEWDCNKMIKSGQKLQSYIFPDVTRQVMY